LFQLKSLLATYAGPDYDGAPLEKADRLMQAMVRQFPTEMEDHREYLAEEGSRVRTLLADRDFRLGKYYESKGENRAAGIYYTAVAERYKDTPLADEAVQRVAAIADEQPEPVQVVPWFVEMFPDPKAAKPMIDTVTR
jgi:outer membrane protein assembly factor BamD (BamD/ComL family)